MSPASRAALFAIAGDAVLTIMDAMIKGVATSYPTLQVAAIRFGCGTLVALVLFAWFRPGAPTRDMVRAHALRSVLVVITAVSFFYALGKLPLGETIALAFLSPLLMALFGGLLLKEQLDAKIWIAIAVGFLGMLLISSPHIGATEYGSGAMWGIAAVMVSTVSYALAVVALRARARQDPAVTIVLFQNAGPALLLAVPAALVWQPVNSEHMLTFAALGVLGVVGHMLLAMAFAQAEAARLAPLHYLTLVWGIALGYVVYAERPTLAMLAGAGLIICATIISHRRT